MWPGETKLNVCVVHGSLSSLDPLVPEPGEGFGRI